MKKIVLAVGVVVMLLVVVGWKVGKPDMAKFSGMFSEKKVLTKDEAKNKTLDLVKSLISPGTEIAIKEVSEYNDGLYKITLGVNKQDIDVYLTKDGEKFFPEAMDANPKEKTASKTDAKKENKTPTDIPKTDKPDVKLFVMSYCPFGTQIEKGILPVLETLGNKIKFTLEFVDYAMHDKKELDENLRQYCIQKNQPAKLNAYLTCFLKKGEGTEEECMNSAGVTVSQVSTCMDATDKQFKISESYADKSTWSNGKFPPFDVNKDDNEKYGVQGSPTLVINDTVAEGAGRDAASLLKTICPGFNNAPAECQKELSSSAPSSGFGEGSGSGSNSSCGG